MTAHFKFPSPRLAAVLAAAVMVVAGCGDDGGGPTGGGNADTTPPSVSSVTAVDQTHIDVVFDENLDRTTAEDTDNYVIVEAIPLTASAGGGPGDTLVVFAAALKSDQRTVGLTTESMVSVPYDMNVTGVRDVRGNRITTPVVRSFDGSSDPDVTPPELVYRSPGPNATNVPIGTTILLTFSEGVTYSSFINGFTISSTGGPVSYAAGSDDNGVHVDVTPDSPLALGTQYTITMTGIEDYAANVMPDATWSFTTTGTMDMTPPTLVSSSPANNATNVSVNATLSMTFSEAIDQSEVQASTYPSVGDGVITWSNQGRTLSFTPFAPLAGNQQYTITILPDGIRDLAGNGNTQFIQFRFSTGSSLASGSFTGRITGDPTSNQADDPTGARVFALAGDLSSLDDVQIAGSALVAGNDTYDVRNLPDDVYAAFALMDSNGDGKLDPEFGDAVGAYGVDFSTFDLEPDTVLITGGGRVTGVDFNIYDFSAITGTVSYSGIHAGEMHFVGVGLFSTSGFDPSNPPDYGTDAYWPDGREWGFLNVDDGFPDGSYYVGAFLDVNDNFNFDLGVDPAGFYGGDPPTAIVIANGSDANGIVIPILDVVTSQTAAKPVAWRTQSERNAPAWLHQLGPAIAKAKAEKQW